MRIKKIYIADDGKEFDSQFGCEAYEWRQRNPEITGIHIFDRNGNELFDACSSETYENMYKVVVDNDAAVGALQDLSANTMMCEYSWITEPGVWTYNDESWWFEKTE